MMQTFFFYPHILDNLTAPDKGFEVYQDMADKRLRLYVTARGAKTFFIRKRVKGKDIRIILGKYPLTSIDKAREAVNLTLEKVFAPLPAKKKLIKFSVAMKSFMAEKVHRELKSEQKLKRSIENLLKPLESRYLNEITSDELKALNNDIIKNHGAPTANRMRETIKSMFNFGILKNWIDENPAIGLRPALENRRKNNLTMVDLKKIISKIKKEENQVLRNAFLMLIFGFMNKSAVFSMEWDYLDLKLDFYKSHPLTDSAVVLLRDIPQTDRWIFPNGRGGHISDPRISWLKIVKEAGLTDVQMNDCTKLLRKQLKWSGNAETLRKNMNQVLSKLG